MLSWILLRIRCWRRGHGSLNRVRHSSTQTQTGAQLSRAFYLRLVSVSMSSWGIGMKKYTPWLGCFCVTSIRDSDQLKHHSAGQLGLPPKGDFSPFPCSNLVESSARTTNYHFIPSQKKAKLGHTVDDRNPAWPSTHTVLPYEVMQDLHHTLYFNHYL